MRLSCHKNVAKLVNIYLRTTRHAVEEGANNKIGCQKSHEETLGIALSGVDSTQAVGGLWSTSRLVLLKASHGVSTKSSRTIERLT